MSFDVPGQSIGHDVEAQQHRTRDDFRLRLVLVHRIQEPVAEERCVETRQVHLLKEDGALNRRLQPHHVVRTAKIGVRGGREGRAGDDFEVPRDRDYIRRQVLEDDVEMLELVAELIDADLVP